MVVNGAGARRALDQRAAVADMSLVSLVAWSDPGAVILSRCDSKTLGVLRLACKALRDGVHRSAVAAAMHESSVDGVEVDQHSAHLARLSRLREVTISGYKVRNLAAIASVVSQLRVLKLDLEDLRDDAVRLSHAVAFPALETLDVDVRGLGEGGLRALFDPARGFTFPALRRLRINQEQMERLAMVEVLRDAHLPALESLIFEGIFFSYEPNEAADGFGTSLGAGNWPRLRELAFGKQCILGPEDAAELATSAAASANEHHFSWARLETLRMHNSLDGRTLAKLAAAFPALKVLQLHGARLLQLDYAGNAAAADAFAKWTQLEELDLSHLRGPADGIQTVLGGLVGARWPRLARLTISYDGNDALPPAVADTLSRGAWPLLRELALPKLALGDAGAALLARAPWPMLQRLDLSGWDISIDGATALASTTWPLRELVLDHNPRLGPGGAQRLAAAAWSRNLTSLELCSAGVGAEGLAAIGGAFPRLRRLELSDNGIDDASGAAALAGVASASLTKLDLSRNALGPRAAAALARLALPALRELSLHGNALGHQGLAALAAGARWPKLRQLFLVWPVRGGEGEERFDAAALLELARGRWPCLQQLWCFGFQNGSVDGNQVARAALKSRWPDIKLII